MTKDVAMQPLTDSDYEVIEAAQKAIQRNYDAIHDNHTVGAAVRCKSGKISTCAVGSHNQAAQGRHGLALN